LARPGLAAFALTLCVTSATWAADAPSTPAPTARDAVRELLKELRGGPSDPATRQPPAGEQRAAYDEWVRKNRESVDGVRPGPLNDLPWGFSTFRPGAGGAPARLYLHVFDWHVGGKLIAYGLSRKGVRRAFFLADPRSDLAVSNTDRDLIVAIPRQAPDPIATVVVLETDGEPKTLPLAVQPKPDGTIVLHARDGIVHGKTLRYEPEPHKDTVGYWMDPTDWVRWEFDVKQPGTYDAVILQGCGKGHGGSTVAFSAAGQTLTTTVEDTGGFQNFVPRRIGAYSFDKPGRHTLAVKPTRKAGVAVMDLRQVTLTPAKQ
jgi:alpha-L-fucosidase